MSGDILTVKTVKRVRSVRGSALVHIIIYRELVFFICLVPSYNERELYSNCARVNSLYVSEIF